MSDTSKRIRGSYIYFTRYQPISKSVRLKRVRLHVGHAKADKRFHEVILLLPVIHIENERLSEGDLFKFQENTRLLYYFTVERALFPLNLF
jgi:hypothetical protein